MVDPTDALSSDILQQLLIARHITPWLHFLDSDIDPDPREECPKFPRAPVGLDGKFLIRGVEQPVRA